MAFAKTVKGAKERVKIKRKLRALGVKGWQIDEPTYKLKEKLRKAKK